MATEISAPINASAMPLHQVFTPAEVHKAQLDTTQKIEQPVPDQKKNVHIQVKELNDLAKTLDKRLQFVIDQDTKDIIVKVIDANTDKVIKELPEEELQKLHKSIKEALGLLINELI